MSYPLGPTIGWPVKGLIRGHGGGSSGGISGEPGQVIVPLLVVVVEGAALEVARPARHGAGRERDAAERANPPENGLEVGTQRGADDGISVEGEPRSPRLPALPNLFRRLSPQTELSIDSNLLAALVGHTNGRGGGARTLTAWQGHYEAEGSARAREDAIAMVFGPSRMFQLAMSEYVRQGLMPPPPPALQLGVFDAETPR